MLEIKKILVPIDFSDYSLKALDYAIDFAAVTKAELFIVNVIEPIVYPTDFTMGEVVPTFESTIEVNFSDQLKKIAEEKIGDKLKYHLLTKEGRPFLEIISAANETDADLIIIATHGHTGMEHILFGSTAEKVVRKAPCPVLSLRDPIKGFSYGKNEK